LKCSIPAVKKIASGKHDKEDTERLFDLAKKGRYPGIFSELAESFGMMMVKVEAREFRLKQIIEEKLTKPGLLKRFLDWIAKGADKSNMGKASCPT